MDQVIIPVKTPSYLAIQRMNGPQANVNYSVNAEFEINRYQQHGHAFNNIYSNGDKQLLTNKRLNSMVPQLYLNKQVKLSN